MRRDLVEDRGWIAAEEYETGLALAAACPGPLAYQLAVYCGYARHRVAGALAVAVAFAAAPFLLVLAAAAGYRRYGDAWTVRALFDGVGPVVLAIVIHAAWHLGRRTLGEDRPAWALAAIAAAITAVLQREVTAIFVVAALLGPWLWASRAASPEAGPAAPPPTAPPPRAAAGLLALAPGTVAAGAPTSLALFVFFFETGLVVFGSGLVVAPFLKAYVVDAYGWLTDREFVDAVAIGIVSPGPVVITATFVGYLVAGTAGALAATAGIFAPALLFTIAAAPLFQGGGGHPWVRGAVRGLTVATVGVLAGSSTLIGRAVVTDAFGASVALAAVLARWRWRSLPEPVLVAAGAVLGLLAASGAARAG
jgi:chromate transporter